MYISFRGCDIFWYHFTVQEAQTVRPGLIQGHGHTELESNGQCLCVHDIYQQYSFYQVEEVSIWIQVYVTLLCHAGLSWTFSIGLFV